MSRKAIIGTLLVLIVLVLGGIVVWRSITPRQLKINIIKIGAVLELTGEISAYGKAAMNGIKMAANEINNSGYLQGRQVEVVFEDSGSEAKKAVSGIERLISVEKVPIVIGGISSSTTLAMAPIAERNQVVLFSPGASSPDLTKAGDFIFRNYPSDLYEGKIMAEYLYSVGLRRIAVVYGNNDYAKGLANTFRTTFLRLGGMIPVEEGYMSQATDFRTIVTKVSQSETGAAYLPGYYQAVGILLRQLREAGVKKPTYSSTGIEDPRFFSVAGTAAEGVIYPTPSIDFQNPPPAAKEVMEKYKTEFGEDPNYPALLAYDAMKIIALAIRTGGDSPQRIRDGLYKIKGFPGVTGSTTFDEHGDATKPFLFKIARNGKFELLQAPPH